MIFKSKEKEKILQLENELWVINQRISDLKVWCSNDVKIRMITEWLQNPDCDIMIFREKLRKLEEEKS